MLAIFSAIKNKKSLPREAKRSGGVTLIEMILYVVLLTFVMAVIVQMLVSISGVYRNIKITRELESSGTIAMEQMLREIRNASSVEVTDSVLGIHPGTIAVWGIDENHISYEMIFDTASGVLQVSKDGGAPVALTSSPVSATYLLFTHLTSPNSEGVRIELEMSGTAGATVKSERFYGFAVLRGSY